MAQLDKINTIDELETFAKRGMVVSVQNWTEQSVQSHTTYHQSTGPYVPTRRETTYSTSESEKLRLFIKRNDGSEFDVKFHDPGIGVREGHDVTIIFASNKASDSGYPVAIVDHTTGKHEAFGDQIDWLLEKPPQFGCIILFAIPLLLAAFTGPLGFVLAPVSFIGLFVWLRKKHSAFKALKSAVLAQVNQRIGEAEANH